MRRAASTHGLTLAECMIASVVLAVSTSAIAGSLAASYQHQRASANASTAAVASERLLEELLSLPTEGADTVDDLHNYSDVLDTRTLARTVTGDSSALQLTDGQSAINVVAPTSVGGGDDETSHHGSVVRNRATSAIDRASVTDKVRRRVSVMRSNTPGGPAVVDGNLVMIQVETEDADGRTIRVKRLVSGSESNSR